MPNYFIDSHCHMFTMADIPLYRSIEQILENSDKPITYLALPLIPFIRPWYDPKNALRDYQPYIRYFESEPEQVVKQLAGQATKAVATAAANGMLDPVDQVILTPLVMDFDAGAEVTKLRGQAGRLQAAIAAAEKSATDPLPANVRVLPFLGINPGREDIDDLLSADKGYDVRSIAARGGIKKAGNGSFVGVKLYPPLGFDVYPEKNPTLKSRYLKFYGELAQSGLPVTVHCQKGSFSLIDKDDKEDCTTPMNWEAVFNNLSEEDRNRFRINFAHFGGDDGVYHTVGFRPAEESDHVLVEMVHDGTIYNTWTNSIIRLLKKYPHTYSDLAAFNFKEDALVCLLWILYLDGIGKFKDFGPHPLIDKLIWGSDYPMILNKDMADYGALLKKFSDAFTFAPKMVGKWQYPPLDKLPQDKKLSQRTFIQKLVCENPMKFLCG